MSWKSKPWLVVDTETTGLDDPRIVELGAVVMHEGCVLTYRSALYNPGRPIDPRASEVHGITDAMVADRRRIDEPHPKTGRTAAQGLEALAAEYDCAALVGYNLIAFDLPLLRAELGPRFVELEAGIGPTVDPLVVVRLDHVGRYWRGQGRHKLTAVAERLGVEYPEPGMADTAHRAAWDCVLAGRILWRLIDHLPDDEGDVREMMEREGKAQREALDAYWKSKERDNGR